jgi:hypothetical protein
MTQPITAVQLTALENVIDKAFNKIGIDVEFSRHFFQRLSDDRNGEVITMQELGKLFAKEFTKWRHELSAMKPDSEAVMLDLSSDINVPFVMNANKRTGLIDMVAKTIMRKEHFRTPDRQFPVESVTTDAPQWNWIVKSDDEWVAGVDVGNEESATVIFREANSSSPTVSTDTKLTAQQLDTLSESVMSIVKDFLANHPLAMHILDA